MSRPAIPVLDEVNKRIIRQLQIDCTVPRVVLYRKLKVKRTTFGRRLQMLREQGVILGYQVVVDPQKVGLEIIALLTVRFDRAQKKAEAFEALVRACPEVLECYEMARHAGYLLKIAASSLSEYKRITDKLMVDGVSVTESDFVLRTIKMNGVVPIR